MVAKSFLQSVALGALLTTASMASAMPIAPGDIVEIGNANGNAFTPSPVLEDSNGLHRGVRFLLDGQTNKRASAGMFVLDYRFEGGDWNEFYSFCLQPDVFLMPFSNPYTVSDLPSSGYNTAISELWGRNRANVLDDISAAAFQVAIWELAYDGDRSLDTGSFQLVSRGAVRRLASNWLAELDGTGWMASNLRVLSNSPKGPDRQDLITAVPEPTSLALLLGCLGALSLRRRR